MWLKNTTCRTICGQLGDHTMQGVNTHTLMDKLHNCVTTLVSTTDSEDKNFDVEFAC